MSTFKIQNGKFVYNDVPVRIISGSIHYCRVVPEYWRDRLEKLKNCGFNTVETYVAWNLHEPEEGKFNFEGIADIERFIKVAQELGLFVIVRPSPYICGEWEFGGLPAWLLKDKNMRLRCFYKPFLDCIDRYYDELMKRLVPLLCTNDGPIIGMQIENEYGSYGNDKKYLEYLRQGLIKRGVDVLLFTSDGPGDLMLQGGTITDVYKTVNFGSRVEESFNKLREYEKEGPLMCMEYWNGWFDHWGEKHHTRGGEEAAKVFEEMLKKDGSVNFYMFHGGTNFGFFNGANHSDIYQPTVTSYDYDCLLTEDGELTPKYHAVKDVIKKYHAFNEVSLSEKIKKVNYGEVILTEKVSIFDTLDSISKPIKSSYVKTMEECGQNYGFILYSTKVAGPRLDCKIDLSDMHDRAQVFVNKKYIGTVYRNDESKKIDVDFTEEINTLDILVENMGRINYGPKLKDFKGISENVRLDYQFHYDWDIYPIPLDKIENIRFDKNRKSSSKGIPMFYKGEFYAEEVGDTFALLDGFEKGVIFVNGFNIGRYWEIGPQKTLYVPAPIIKKGKNEVLIFELHKTDKEEMSFLDKPNLG
ncbi:beta-galactosidase [Clostridium swellfunianum]|uniref:glycoside hydrolase family 35 protein n=1 Tax=Clostridium swellfunianum TaxID=1367462 RepID=UPI00202E118A|nr:beta-galactosidase family protein [Clostridium swellfunianum]MCM0646996.1 beta-galactosidase [Clostridium swellfunianum]